MASAFNDLAVFAKIVNIKNMTIPQISVRVRDILNADKNRSGGYCSLKQAIVIATMIKELTS
jgi:hypothetical protein